MPTMPAIALTFRGRLLSALPFLVIAASMVPALRAGHVPQPFAVLFVGGVSSVLAHLMLPRRPPFFALVEAR